MSAEFKAWPKIERTNPFTATISEKIDGTNACIIISGGEIVGVQSRKRFITPEDDNFGFASWVESNNEQLLSLGDGYHYGEWAGEGIQKNPHKIEGKKFFLFNTFRWGEHNPETPKCCHVVPVLFIGELSNETIGKVMEDLADDYSGEPEGVVCYYHAFRNYTKLTFKYSGGKWKG